MMNRIAGFLIMMLVLTGTGLAGVTVETVDLTRTLGLETNAAGPLLVRMDAARNRLLVANTLSSSFTLIDGQTHAVTNIPLDGRAYQHLKNEAMTFNSKNGDVYLVGDGLIHIISPENRSSRSIATEVQYESITVDESSGNAYVAGRESRSLGMIDASSGTLTMLDWTDHEERLINLNQTPPPPIRKVVTDNRLGQVLALDGFTGILHRFDVGSGECLDERKLGLTTGGRWHLAGYDQETHCLYLVTETDDRKVIQAAKIDVVGGEDTIVSLPELTEGVGITYNPVRDEIYIAYDNHPTVHAVDFAHGGALSEIKIPAYGNDAVALDARHHILYIGSWAHGELDIVDLETRELRKRITGLGIIPHMFAMAFNPNNNLIYFPRGASAVNGTFGAAISVFDPSREELEKIPTGWAPIDLIPLPARNSVLVFNNEDEFAEVRPDGFLTRHRLPEDYPVKAIHDADGDVYLSYGPHQSYWPVVYIWDARNGVLGIGASDLAFYDRRIPRQALQMVLDRSGILHFTQNNWGKEKQFLGRLDDPVRVMRIDDRLELETEVEREVTQRILEYDSELDRLYLVRAGEKDDEPSVLQVIDQTEKKVVQEIELGLTATDLVFDNRSIYVANFDSDSVSVVDRKSFELRTVKTGPHPLKMCSVGEAVFVLTHTGKSLQCLGDEEASFTIPGDGLPDNLFSWNGTPVITVHSRGMLRILAFDPENESFSVLHEHAYPYGDTRFDRGNASFYIRGQYGDAVPFITRAVKDIAGRLWLTDFLSGRVFILTSQ